MSSEDAWKGEPEPTGPFGWFKIVEPSPEQIAEQKERHAKAQAASDVSHALAPRYTGASVVCVKCGHVGAKTRFYPSEVGSPYAMGGIVNHIARPAHLRRICRNCRHAWVEKPLDAENPL